MYIQVVDTYYLLSNVSHVIRKIIYICVCTCVYMYISVCSFFVKYKTKRLVENERLRLNDKTHRTNIPHGLMSVVRRKYVGL